MKWIVVTSLAALMAVNLQSQPVANQYTNAASPGAVGTSTNLNLPPGVAKRTNSSGADQMAQSPNALTNQLGAMTNLPGGVPGGGLTPTSEPRPGATNRMYNQQQPGQTGATNAASAGAGATANASANVTVDRAFSAADQKLLITIRQNVEPQFQSTTASRRSPIHYIVQEGAVTLVGAVPTAEEKQRCEMVVQRIPGVTQVINELQINASGGSSASVATETSVSGPAVVGVTNTAVTNQFGLGTNTLAPTSRSTNSATRIYSNTNQGSAFPSATPIRNAPSPVYDGSAVHVSTNRPSTRP